MNVLTGTVEVPYTLMNTSLRSDSWLPASPYRLQVVGEILFIHCHPLGMEG